MIQVTLDNIAYGGKAVGTVTDGPNDLVGMRCFVAGGIPGEVVKGYPTKIKKNHCEARLTAVLTPSPSRCVSPCQHFEICGGCDFLHMTPEEQVRSKSAMLRSMITHAKLPESVLHAIKPLHAGPFLGYRRRATFHCTGNGTIGFYKRGTREAFVHTQCPILAPPIEQKVPHLINLGAALQGIVGSLHLECDDQEVWACFKHPAALSVKVRSRVIKTLETFFPHGALYEKNVPTAQWGALTLVLQSSDGSTFEAAPGSFSQVNWTVNQALVAKVLAVVQEFHPHSLWDLYAGAGNFSIPLAQQGSIVAAVEADQTLCQTGARHAEGIGLTKNISFIHSSVEKFLASRPKPPPLILADPPRSGLPASFMVPAATETLILISCHVPSFIRDCAIVLSQGLKIHELQPYDMFAGTGYLELLSVFSRA